MSLSTLDPKTALIVIDLQQGVAVLPTAHPVPIVVTHAARLADAFRARGLPVVLVNVAGFAPGRNEQPRRSASQDPNWSTLLSELGAQAGDHLVTKRSWGAFTGTDLEDYLRRWGVTQVVLCGIATSIGVESTARQAHELGFNVALAVDAMTDVSGEAHTNSVQRIFPRLGETATTRELLDLLRASAKRTPA
jgi:nicotinamidase-related amidase